MWPPKSQNLKLIFFIQQPRKAIFSYPCSKNILTSEVIWRPIFDLWEVMIQCWYCFWNPWPKTYISTFMKQILILTHFDLSEVIWRPICGLWEVIIQNYCYFWNPWPKKPIFWHSWSKYWYLIILTSQRSCGGQYVASKRPKSKTKANVEILDPKNLYLGTQ